MTLKEAMDTLDSVIPSPENKMVDIGHQPIAAAWQRVKTALSPYGSAELEAAVLARYREVCEKTETISTLDCTALAIAEYEKEHGKFALAEGESFIAMLRNCALVFTMENGEVKATVVGGKPYTLNVFCDIFKEEETT